MPVRTFICPILGAGRVLSALTFGASLAMATGAMAQNQTGFARECAMREIAVITLIEDLGEVGSLPADQLNGAALTHLRARSVCYAGRIEEALALYDSVLALGPAQSVKR